MTENKNENIDPQNENNEESCDCSSSSCCSGSDHVPASNKLKFAGFAVIMLLAAAVAGNALNQKHKNGSIDACGTNACVTCPSQLGTTGSCPDGGGDDCAMSASKDAALAGCPSSSDGCSSASAGCPSQADTPGTCEVKGECGGKAKAAAASGCATGSGCPSGDAVSACSMDPAATPAEKTCCGSPDCKDKK
jgi:hypothetical protein